MNVENIAFKTRARTIDHLGREQIADCPTAVSELWKNAYDAYAERVELNIYDGNLPVAAIADDGHGMSKEDFINKWLVVGTDSKVSDFNNQADHRTTLKRPRQGQKGIGRLSCANLGSLLLLISKSTSAPFAAALIDWRIFENPFLMLQDIQIPVIEFSLQEELVTQLPIMFDALMSNIWGSGKHDDKDRTTRIVAAWAAFDQLELRQGKPSTKSAVEETIISASFDDRHFSCWDVWTNKSSHGTAMFMANISDDLQAQLSTEPRQHQPDAIARAQERLFQTLSNFVDPFARQNEISGGGSFSTAVIAWNGLLRRPILDETRSFRIENLDDLEHLVEGKVDTDGVFRGHVKAFGKWLPDEIQIKPSELYKSRADTACGAFHLRLGTYERDSQKSTHSKEQHQFLAAQAELYSGFMVYRDGLRVMPYGREDNDYFEIEKRRTQHAGRFFWSNRNLFGRVLITRHENPNLKDKAGREGLIDNKASKRFRSLVENVLIETAKKYFGTDSANRKAELPDIAASNAKIRAENDKKKLNSLQRKRFRANLKNNAAALDEYLKLVEELILELASLDTPTIPLVTSLKQRISNFLDQGKDFSLSPVPSSLGSLEEAYRAYRKKEKLAHSLLIEANASVNTAIEKLAPKAPREIILQQLQSYAAQLHSRIRKWSVEGRVLLSEEITRFNEVVDHRNKAFHAATAALADEANSGQIELNTALRLLDEEYQRQYSESADLFIPYLSSLKNMREQIDYENALTHATNESSRLRDEVERLHSLAQLGITVEIVGHEIEALDMTVTRGLRALPDDVKETPAFKSISLAQQALSDRWRFLSPLKLSGEKYRTNISGNAIFEYVERFLGEGLHRDGIVFSKSSAFSDLNLYEQPSRLFPVFINLVNNSRYWVMQNDNQPKQILLDYIDGNVYVSDTGPGVDDEDIENLFSLFFTRKNRGGRGIGLYLCRTNLLAGGHSIYYETDKKKKQLSGANFVIGFKGAINNV